MNRVLLFSCILFVCACSRFEDQKIALDCGHQKEVVPPFLNSEGIKEIMAQAREEDKVYNNK